MSLFPLNPYLPPVTGSPVVTHVDTGSTSNNNTTYNFSGRSFGAAANDRYIVVSVHGDVGPQTPVSATIGGVAATLVYSTPGLGIFIAYLPTGTTGTVSVTFTGSVSRCGFSVWRVTGLWRGGVERVASGSGTGVTASVAVSYPAKSVIIAAATFHNSAGTAATWVNISTPDYYGSNGNTTRWMGAHESAQLAGPSSKTIQVSDASAPWRIAAVVLR